ncbi:cbb3-type cytochrome oxidase assembly protein CcoS [Stappia indica]|uniref:Cytochrome oxidase maturation protein, cbb3-type n=1 Tax=Stappia indica TaxID=538381 RepID=A0A285SRB1_9HYPH|nr:cbb3-type cytochrome oxidase assembly protein CcoS [Stappia indica]MCC4243867.1 cbb3-type cytochrome oxidase assembly protein CcoS [Stappia indica]SOC10807.1 cytochrome oxidase maturation protein, cbb3-type [Stappia indica]
MDVLVYLIPAALVLGLLGLAGFLWSLKSGQYEDLEGAKYRILQDDDLPEGDGKNDERG